MMVLSDPLYFTFESCFAPSVSNVICSYLDVLATVMPKPVKKRKQDTDDDENILQIGAISEYPLRLSYISTSVQSCLFACNKES